MGTNGVGKTTLAKRLIERFGGIKQAGNTITLCNDDRVCFAGRYSAESKFGGVDSFSSTKGLESVVKEGLAKSDLIFCEGSFLNSIGLNLTNAVFVADKQLVVLLYCEGGVLQERLKERSNGKVNESVIKKHKCCVRAFKKWAEIGVPAIAIDTSTTDAKGVEEKVITKLYEIAAI